MLVRSKGFGAGRGAAMAAWKAESEASAIAAGFARLRKGFAR
jgi:hypothetical protein